MMPRWWDEPTVGEIVWCHFPNNVSPHPKPRPALILAVFDDDVPQFHVQVTYGTSQRTTTLHRGEFSILRERNPAAFGAAGLGFDTRFDLKQALGLPYTTGWSSVPPAAPQGQSRKLGTLHPLTGARCTGCVSGGKSISAHRRLSDWRRNDKKTAHQLRLHL